jgi:hypothetical protein
MAPDVVERSDDGEPGEPVQELDRAIAASMRVLRERHRSVAAFASAVAALLGRPSLSRQAIYDWEQGRTRIPAAVWVAAATLVGMTPNEALDAGLRRSRPGGGRAAGGESSPSG